MVDILDINRTKFTEKLDLLKAYYKENCSLRANETLLLGPERIPICRHMLFKPLSDELIDEYLSEPYKNKFPTEYAEFLKYSNGANLFYTRRVNQKLCYAACLFIIFGLPRKKPYGRPMDEEEPYDVRIEDLGRHHKIPSTWLKCGRYIKNYEFKVTYEIFIDTDTGKVYGCERNNYVIVDAWEDLNQCFCDIYNSFADIQNEYVIHD